MSEDLGKQVELQAQLNQLLQDRIKLQQKLNAACGQQCGYADEMNASAQEAQKNTQAQTQATDDQRKAQDKARKSAGGFFSTITEGQAAAAGGTVGLIQGFKDVGAQLSAAGGMIKSFVGGLFNIGKAIIAIPFKLFSGLITMANNAAQAGTALRQAYEDVRKEFGSFAEGPAKNVIAGFNDMSSSAGNLGGTGLSVSRVFGYGPDGMAKMMGAVSDIAKGLGPAINLLGDEFGKSAEQAVMFSKGLGLSGEQMGALMKDAALSGQSQSEMMTEVGSMSLQMAEKFGLSSKDIGKDIADMKGDFVSFGNMSTAQMGAASAFARKLGMDMKDLKGVVDKFDDFEGAADSVSQLNQAFGIQLDTMKMMNAENPAERIDMMRDAFFAAGKSIETMTRQEKKLLMAQTGLTESALKNAFAAESQGMSYEDFADAAGDAEENQLSQEEVMLKLAKAIEKIAEAGQSFSGIGDAFGKGFMHAMSKDKDMRELMTTIREFLREVFNFGKDVGKVFMDLMRHTGMFKGLKKLFDPASFRKLFKDLMGPIKDFAKFIMTGEGDPDKIFQSFADKLTNFFGSKSGALSDIGGALQRMGEMLIKALIAMASWLWKTIKPMLMPMITSALKAIGEFLGENWHLIAAAIGIMLSIAFAKALAGAALGIAAKKFAQFVGGKIFGVADKENKDAAPIFESTDSSISGVQKILSNIREVKYTDILKASVIIMAISETFAYAIETFGEAMANVAKALGPVSWNDLGKALVVTAAAVLAMYPLIDAGKEIADMGAGKLIKAGLGLTGAAAIFSGSIIAYSKAVQIAAGFLKGVAWGTFAKILVMVGAALGATYGLILAGAPLALLIPVMVPAGLGLAAAAGFFTVGVLAYSKAIAVIYDEAKAINWKHFASTLAGVAVAVAATGGLLAVGAIAFLASFGGFQAAGYGLEKAAEFFVRGVLAYSEAIAEIHDTAKSIKWKHFASTLAGVGVGIAATSALLGAGAIMALASLGFGVASYGLEKSAEFFVGGVQIFAEAIAQTTPAFNKMYQSRKATTFGLDAMDKILYAISGLKSVAASFGMMNFLFGDKFKDGVETAADFFVKVVPVFTDMVKAIARLPITNPKSVQAKLDIVGGAISAMQAMAELGFDAAKMAMVAKFLGGGSMKEMIESMAGFISAIGATLTSVIVGLSLLAQSLPSGKDNKEKVGIVAEVISAVAALAGALFAPLEAVQEMGTSMFGPSVQETMKIVVQGVKDLMCAIKGFLPDIVGMVIKLAGGIGNPKVLKPKMKIISLAMKSVAEFSKAIGAMQKLIPDGKTAWYKRDKNMDERLEEMMSIIKKIVAAVKNHVSDVVQTIIGIPISGDLETVQKKMTIITASMDAMSKFATVVETIKGIGAIEDIQPTVAKIASAIIWSIGPSKGYYDISDVFYYLELFKPKEGELTKLDTAISAVRYMTRFAQSVGDMQKAGASYYGNLSTAVSGMVYSIERSIDHLKRFDNMETVTINIQPFEALGTSMTKVQNLFSTYREAYFGEEGTIATIVKEMVDTYNTVYGSLQDLSSTPKDFKVQLDKFADTLGVGKDTFTVNNEQLNFTINVSVQLDAEKMVDTLSDKSTMGRRTVRVVGAE